MKIRAEEERIHSLLQAAERREKELEAREEETRKQQQEMAALKAELELIKQQYSRKVNLLFALAIMQRCLICHQRKQRCSESYNHFL